MSKGKVRRAVSSMVVGHWCQLINHLKASPLEFYGRLESLLSQRQVPKLESAQIEWREGGPLSAKRRYMRFLRERITFDIMHPLERGSSSPDGRAIPCPRQAALDFISPT